MILSFDSCASATAERAWPGSICSVQIDAAVVCSNQKYIWHGVDKRRSSLTYELFSLDPATMFHSVEGGKDEGPVLVSTCDANINVILLKLKR